MIKSLKDVKKMVNGLKESGNIINYETDNDIIVVGYDEDNDNFIMDSQSRNSRIKSSHAKYNETCIINQIWIDRKHINKSK